ncbi:MAG: hypothetical protein BV458_06685, partial [Thermoplasmata archaeon M9B2D]
MTNEKFIKIAGVLLLSAILLFSAVAVTANTKDDRAVVSLSGESKIVNTNPSTTRDVLYDNGLPNGVNGLSVGVWPGYDREVADDFVATDNWDVTGGEARILTYSGTSSVNGMKMIFYQDAGDIPSTTTYASKDATITCTLTGNYYFSRPEILVACTIESTSLAAGDWWVVFQPQHTENCFILTSDVKGNSVYVSYPDLAYPKWTNGYTVFAAYHDVAWLLIGGGGGGDTTPPVTTCTLDGDMEGGIYISDVTVTLTATDDDSGVNYTMYKLDDGAWTTYEDPFVVTEDGEHTVYFYSVDNAGNIEDEKSETFTIQHPAPSISITIKGGFGVSAEIKNTGETNLTDIDWTISLNGSLIFVGKTKSGTIASLAPGDTETVKTFVLGIGKTGIAVEAGD